MTIFGTLTAARNLEDAGMEPKVAAAVSAAIRMALGSTNRTVAVPLELATTDDLRTEIAAMESHLTWRMVWVVGGAAVLFSALDLLFG